MMRHLFFGSSPLAAVCAVALLAGCGGPPREAQAPETSQPPSGEVTAQQYPDCDPAYYCRVPSMYFTCADGVMMWAFSTPDGGYCIERNACDGHGGPSCPYE